LSTPGDRALCIAPRPGGGRDDADAIGLDPDAVQDPARERGAAVLEAAPGVVR
jgi:hypothetical protein